MFFSSIFPSFLECSVFPPLSVSFFPFNVVLSFHNKGLPPFQVPVVLVLHLLVESLSVFLLTTNVFLCSTIDVFAVVFPQLLWGFVCCCFIYPHLCIFLMTCLDLLCIPLHIHSLLTVLFEVCQYGPTLSGLMSLICG